MGRKFLTSAAIAAAMFGVAAGPAFAKSAGPTFSNGLRLTARQHALVNTRMQAVDSPSMSHGSAFVVRHGRFAECTVPQGHGGYANFFTTDTTDYFEADGGAKHEGLLIGSCTADLNKKQTSATSSDTPGPKEIIPTPGRYATYSEACNIPFYGYDFIGDAMSIVYKSNMFTEICVVPVWY